jgi:GrpB-like predicted nucleotidyltransferase (UPF0157 family)
MGDVDDTLVGGRERRRIEIVDYDPAWPAVYEDHRARVARALGDAARRIEHIGSTAVPGLAAKPIVDVLVTVADADDEGALSRALTAAGYELRVREPVTGCSERRAGMSTCTSGAKTIRKSRGRSSSAIACGHRRPTVVRTRS